MHGCNLRRASRSALSRGFTLTELLIVIGVIVLLMGLLMPGMGMVRQKAREASTLSLMGAVEQSAFMFRTDHNRMPGYFAQGQIASESKNTQHLTGIENVMLDLGGGIVAPDTAGGANEGVFNFELDGTTHIVNVMQTGASDGPGYLDLGQAVRGGDRADGSPVFIGNKVFRPMDDEDIYITDNDSVTRPIPVVHDYFGKPLMMWSRNAQAGDNADFADITSDLVQDDNGRPRRARYYWWENAGQLGAASQYERSVIGTDLSTLNGVDGGIRKIMVPSMYAILGHPAFHTPPDPNGYVVPTVGLGELVLQSAGADQVFLSNGTPKRRSSDPVVGDDGNGDREIQAFYSGHVASPEPNQRLMREFDDLVHAGG